MNLYFNMSDGNPLNWITWLVESCSASCKWSQGALFVSEYTYYICFRVCIYELWPLYLSWMCDVSYIRLLCTHLHVIAARELTYKLCTYCHLNPGFVNPIYYQATGRGCSYSCVDTIGNERYSRMGKKVEHFWWTHSSMGPCLRRHSIHTLEKEKLGFLG